MDGLQLAAGPARRARASIHVNDTPPIHLLFANAPFICEFASWWHAQTCPPHRPNSSPMRPSSRYTSALPLEELQQSRCHAEVFATADVCSGNDDAGFTALVTFLPGQRPVNVIDMEFIAQLRAALLWLQRRSPPINFALLSSIVPSSFVAGADLKLQTQITNEIEAVAQSAGLLEYTCLFHTMPFVTVALVEGSALGGGLELALACHMCFARPILNKHGTEAQCLSLPEVKLGVLPGAGGCVRLPLRLGLVPALNMILQGTPLSISQAARLGIVDAVWKGQGPAVPGCPPPPEFLPWVVNQLVRQSVRSRSSDGLLSNRMLSLALRFPPFNSLFRSHICRKIDAKTQGHFPAPYGVVNAVMDCWGRTVGVRSKQWPYHFSVDALACAPESREFGRLAVSAESKALMSLFLASKLPAKLAPPPSIPASGPPPTRVAVSFSIDAKLFESSATAIIVALLLSGVSVCILSLHEEFERIVTCAKKCLNQSVNKGAVSADVMAACIERLQRSSQAADVHGNEALLHMSHAEALPLHVNHAGLILCSPLTRSPPDAQSPPALCILTWAGRMSTMCEVIIDHGLVPVNHSSARAAAAAAAIARASGCGVTFTQSSMSASFEVFCAIFSRAVFAVACMAECASAAVFAVGVVDFACANVGWDAGPFELADKLGAAAVHALLVEFTIICERQVRHIGKGLRVAVRIMELLCKTSPPCTFWKWTQDGKKSSVNSRIGHIIKTGMGQLHFPSLPSAAWTPYSIHLQILMSAAEACFSLLQRQAVPNPEILDLLLVAAGYPANQGGVLECTRNTRALSDYESIVESAGPDALDSPSPAWREAYGALFEWRIMNDRPQMMPCQSISKLSRRAPVVQSDG